MQQHLSKHNFSERIYGKLILCGEHSVIFGGSAITFKAPNYLTIEIKLNYSKNLKLNTYASGEVFEISIKDAITIEKAIAQRYLLFLQNKLDISKVILQKFQLVICTIIKFFNHYGIQQGLSVSIKGNVPIGAGMGSSAIISVGTLKLLHETFGIVPDETTLIDMATSIENLQHGKTYGIDVLQVLKGGLNCFQVSISKKKGKANVEKSFFSIDALQNEQLASIDKSLYLVNTGKPASTTGEVVQKVTKKFPEHSSLWQEFHQLTNSWSKNLPSCDEVYFKNMILANQQLLNRIGIVPTYIQKFIDLITKFGGAAKISGAGSIEQNGLTGGLVLVVMEDKKRLLELCQDFKFKLVASLSKWRQH